MKETGSKEVILVIMLSVVLTVVCILLTPNVKNDRAMAQIIGVVLIIVSIVVPHLKEKRNIMLWSVAANILWMIQFLFLEAKAGVVIGTIALIRAIVFYIYSIKDKVAPVWIFVLIMIASIVGTTYSWNAWYCIFLILGFAANIGQWVKSEQTFRVCLAITTVGNGLYLIMTGGISGAINEFMQTGSSIIAVIRNRKKKGYNVDSGD